MQTASLLVSPTARLKVSPLTKAGACCDACAVGRPCAGSCPSTGAAMPSTPGTVPRSAQTRGARSWPVEGPWYRRRTTGDATDGGDAGGDGGDDSPDMEALGQKWANLSPGARRDALERIGRGAGMSTGNTERMITSLATAALATVNEYLRLNAQVEIRRIDANRQITVARIRAQGGVIGDIDGNDGGNAGGDNAGGGAGSSGSGNGTRTTTQRDSSSGSDNTVWILGGLGLAYVAMKNRKGRR